jgi:hypothetical protein
MMRIETWPDIPAQLHRSLTYFATINHFDTINYSLRQ